MSYTPPGGWTPPPPPHGRTPAHDVYAVPPYAQPGPYDQQQQTPAPAPDGLGPYGQAPYGYGAPQPGYAATPGYAQAPQPYGYPQEAQPYGSPQDPAPYGYGHAPQPYGYAQGPSPYGYPRPGNGMAVGAFVVGLLSVLVSWVPFVGLVGVVGGVVAVILGAVATGRVRSGRATGRGLAVAGIVLGALAAVVGIASTALVGSWFSSLDEARPATVAAEQTAALPLGQAAEVGDYTVRVMSVNLDADDVIAASGGFDAPADDQYVMADVTVVYHGSGTGRPWLDLTHVFVGSDGMDYDWATCEATEPSSLLDVPALAPGETAAYQVCMDVPPEAIEGGAVGVEHVFSMSATRTHWQVR